MTTGTKIFLAVFAGFIGVLVLYYGVLMPEAQSLPAISAATRETPPPTQPKIEMATNDIPVIEPDPLPGTGDQPILTQSGVLTEAMQPVATDPLQPTNLALTNVATNVVPIAPAPVPSTPIANQPVSIAGDASTSNEYTIRSGDTLSSIAHDWFGDENKWSLIARENPDVNPNRLKIGQKLRMPAKNATAPTIKEEVAARESTYTVRSGDTLSKIAREYYNDISKWKAIYDANKTAIGSDPANLKAGMKLKLPSKTAN